MLYFQAAREGAAIGLSQAIRDRVRPLAASYLEDSRPGGDCHAAL